MEQKDSKAPNSESMNLNPPNTNDFSYLNQPGSYYQFNAGHSQHFQHHLMTQPGLSAPYNNMGLMNTPTSNTANPLLNQGTMQTNLSGYPFYSNSTNPYGLGYFDQLGNGSSDVNLSASSCTLSDQGIPSQLTKPSTD